jgi:DNA-binding MarR family transcriptional regulator
MLNRTILSIDMPHRDFDRPPQIGALLRLAWEDLQDQLLAGLAAAGFDDLRSVHRGALTYPPIDGLRPGELAVRMNRSKQHTNDVIRALEQRGYITLERDERDRRARVIRLTERGWALTHEGSRLSEQIGRRWAEQIGDDRFEALQDALRAVVALRAPAPMA